MSQIWLIFQKQLPTALASKKLFSFLAFSFQYFGFFETVAGWHILSDWSDFKYACEKCC